MKKHYIYLFTAALTLCSCESVVEGLNKNPNAIETNDIDAGLFVNTPELNLVQILRGLNGRMAALWTGQIVGVNNFPLAYYNYQVTESTFDFAGYQSVITQCKHIQASAPDNPFYQGITRVLEAYLFGFYASAYGDVPATEVATDIEYPKFESQTKVFDYSQQLLDEAINYLSSIDKPQYKQDYLFNGNVKGWIESSYTLKARFYLITKEYDKAYQVALKGIGSPENSMLFRPVEDSQNTNKNNWWQYSQNGFYGTENAEKKQCFLFDLMDSRNNKKTDETARKSYYYIDPTNSKEHIGKVSKTEPEPLITYEENLLILAETGARTKGFDEGLIHLNKLRAYLNGGGAVNENFLSLPLRYEAYDYNDFVSGGLLNTDGILQPERALLKEIILERYVTTFTQFMAWDDARRLRGTGETDIAVAIPLNTTTATAHPERFFYPEKEMLANPNAPEDLGIYTPTEVNRK